MERRAPHGFTLIEMLLTLAVAAILASLAAPSFDGLAARTGIAATNNELIGAIAFARERAVDSAADVIFCPSRDGIHCDATAHWEHGWLVASDNDGDGLPDGAPLRVHDALADNTVILGSVGREVVRYRADGSSPGTNLSLVICRRGNTANAHKVVVSNAGRPREAAASADQAARCAGA